MPTLTIVTMVLNGGKYFERALQSIAAQTAKDFEYIVLDGGSTDATPGLIEKYRSLIAHTVSRKDKGALDAFNRAFALMKGDYIGLLGSDDWLEPDFVACLIAAGRTQPGVISFGLKEWQEAPDGRLTPVKYHIDPDDGAFDMPNALYGHGINRFFRRELYQRHGLYEFDRFGPFCDRELGMRFAMETPRKIVIPEALYHFRRHVRSTSANSLPATAVASMGASMRMAEARLVAGGLSAVQQREIVNWYGFLLARCAFFLLKCGRYGEALRIIAKGLMTHPLACLRVLFIPGMPRRYKPQPMKL